MERELEESIYQKHGQNDHAEAVLRAPSGEVGLRRTALRWPSRYCVRS